MFFPFIFYLKQMLRITRDVSNHTNYSVRNPALLLILAPRISWIPKIKSSCIHDFRLEMKSWSFVPTYNLTYLHTYFFWSIHIFIFLLQCCLFLPAAKRQVIRWCRSRKKRSHLWVAFGFFAIMLWWFLIFTNVFYQFHYFPPITIDFHWFY